MYHYYTYDGRTLCSAGALPYPEISALPETGEVLWVFHRPPLAGRDTFPVTDPAQLTEEEGVASLCAAPSRSVSWAGSVTGKVSRPERGGR